MKNARFLALVHSVFIIVGYTANVSGDARMSGTVELLGGAVYNLPVPVVIRQGGSEDISFRARFATNPFDFPLYYVVRVGKWRDGAAWEAEFIHQKLYLLNRPPQVERFTITHGCNLFMINRAAERNLWVWRIGAGVVIAHPETTVRGKAYLSGRGILGSGYHLSGPAIHAALGRRVGLGGALFLVPEVKLTGTCARIPVSDGSAVVPNVAVHVLLGMGYQFFSPRVPTRAGTPY
jgi:hypothetical protein